MRAVAKGIIGTAVLIYLGVLYGNKALIIVGFVVGVLSLLSIFYLVVLSYLVEVRLLVPVPIIDAGKSAKVSLQVKYKGWIPVAKVRYRVAVRPCHTSKRARGSWMYGTTLMPGKQEFWFPVEIKEAGAYEISVNAVEIYDLTGMFSWRKRCKHFGRVQVFPELTNVGVTVTGAIKNFIGESDVYDDFRPGMDRTQIMGVREYRPGDRMQNVHWKLSAKGDELMVKENSWPKACAVTVLLQDQKSIRTKERSAFLGMAGSLSFSLMDNGCCHYMCWYSEKTKDLVRVRVEDEESYYLFVNAYLEEDGKGSKDDLLERYREKYKAEQCLHLFILDNELCLKEDNFTLVQASVQNWKTKMEELELQV